MLAKEYQSIIYLAADSKELELIRQRHPTEEG
jgi:hypothetical protein